METGEFFDLYLNEAMKINAICFDLNLSADDARLYSFIHIKGLESREGTNYFRKEREEDIISLEILLGKNKNSVEELSEPFENIFICSKLNKLDGNIEGNCGKEFYLVSELSQRFRIYTDIIFRNEKLKFYEENILPRIKDYNSDKINLSFQKQAKKEIDEEEKLKRSLE